MFKLFKKNKNKEAASEMVKKIKNKIHKTEPNYFDLLPSPVIQQEVFGYFNVKTLKSVSQVCKRFRDIAGIRLNPIQQVNKSAFLSLALKKAFNEFYGDNVAQIKQIDQLLAKGADPNIDSFLDRAVERYIKFRSGTDYRYADYPKNYLQLTTLLLDYGSKPNQSILKKAEPYPELYSVLLQYHEQHNQSYYKSLR